MILVGNWEAIGAIGQIAGVIMTLIVGLIALAPYRRRCELYFSFKKYTEKKPTIVIVNN